MIGAPLRSCGLEAAAGSASLGPPMVGEVGRVGRVRLRWPSRLVAAAPRTSAGRVASRAASSTTVWARRPAVVRQSVRTPCVAVLEEVGDGRDRAEGGPGAAERRGEDQPGGVRGADPDAQAERAGEQRRRRCGARGSRRGATRGAREEPAAPSNVVNGARTGLVTAPLASRRVNLWVATPPSTRSTGSKRSGRRSPSPRPRASRAPQAATYTARLPAKPSRSTRPSGS